jgi:hypothetical protein
LERIGPHAIGWFVPTRHVLLLALAGLVMVAGVYLFIQVRPQTVWPEATPQPHAPGTREAQVPQPQPEQVRAPPHIGSVRQAEPVAVPAGSSEPEEPSTDDTIAALERANPKLDAIMDQANKHYDKGEYEDAKAIAGKVLATQPTNIRMMRIMVSSACMDGDVPVAQKWFEQLPKADREQMKVRCAKYEVKFTDPPQ